MLFSFNEEFISAIAGGLNDDDTLELFADGVGAMIAEAQEYVERTAEREVPMFLVDDQLVIPVTDEEMQREYGDDQVAMQPLFRSGLIQAQSPARRGFDRAVNQ